MSDSSRNERESAPRHEKEQPKGPYRDLRSSAEPSRSHPITGKAYAEKVSQAFDAKSKLKDPISAFKSFQSIMIEHARLMSWLWGGAAAVGVIAYVIYFDA